MTSKVAENARGAVDMVGSLVASVTASAVLYLGDLCEAMRLAACRHGAAGARFWVRIENVTARMLMR